MTSPSPDPQWTPVAELLADLPTPHDGDAPGQTGPPTWLRSRLFEQIRASAADAALPPREQLPAAARSYRDQVAAVDDLLTALPTPGWTAPVVKGWDVRELVGHLLAVDALAAAALGLPTPAQTGSGDDVATRTATVHDLHASADPAALQRVWRAQAVALLRHADAVGDPGLDRPVTFLGLQLSAADVLLDRGFETWVHGDDLRDATGRPALLPAPDDVTRLADLGLRMLPRAWAGAGLPERTDVLDVELTGPGGGSWQLRPDGRVTPAAVPSPRGSATLRMDVLEFCAVAGGRRVAADAVHAGEGDPAVVAAALAAVEALARL